MPANHQKRDRLSREDCFLRSLLPRRCFHCHTHLSMRLDEKEFAKLKKAKDEGLLTFELDQYGKLLKAEFRTPHRPLEDQTS